MVVHRVPVPAGRVGLPDLHQRGGHGAAVAVEHPPAHDDPLALRLPFVLGGEIGVGGGGPLRQEQRPPRRPQRRRPVVGEVERRVDTGRALITGNHEPGAGRCRVNCHYRAPSPPGVMACKARNAESSAGEGASITSTLPETARSHPVAPFASSGVTPGYTPVRVSSQVTGSGSSTPRSVMTLRGPAPVRPSRSRSPRPVPYPTEVTKSTRSTKDRRLCRTMMITSRQNAAISGAPPAPGSRTFGSAYLLPMTVVLMLPNLSSCAAPRNPTSIRPGCSQ